MDRFSIPLWVYVPTSANETSMIYPIAHYSIITKSRMAQNLAIIFSVFMPRLSYFNFLFNFTIFFVREKMTILFFDIKPWSFTFFIFSLDFSIFISSNAENFYFIYILFYFCYSSSNLFSYDRSLMNTSSNGVFVSSFIFSTSMNFFFREMMLISNRNQINFCLFCINYPSYF